MNSKTCPSCGGSMKRNGRTKAGSQRWRCPACGASATHSIDVTGRELERFLGWLLSKERQVDMPGRGRSFRRLAERFWRVWPVPEFVDEVHRVVFVDGIYLARDCVVLIARSREHTLSWHLAESESRRAYEELMSKVVPPEVVVCDGGSGFASAARSVWPQTRVQRCLYHVFCQVRRYTTSRPRLQAGRELYALALELLHVETLGQAEWWVERYLAWCEFWDDFLEERTRTERGLEYTHERLRKARRSVSSVLGQQTMFTYLDPALTAEGPLPSTNNLIEGGTNARIREMLRNHRGMSLMRRIKATFWLCYMDTERPLPASEILSSMPTDDDMELLRRMYGPVPRDPFAPEEWGSGLVWEELHRKTRYPFSTE